MFSTMRYLANKYTWTQDAERGRTDTASSHGLETSESMDDGQANDGSRGHLLPRLMNGEIKV